MRTPQKSMSKMFKLMRSKFGKKHVEFCILQAIANVETRFPTTPNKLRTVVMTPLRVDNHVGIRWQHSWSLWIQGFDLSDFDILRHSE